MAIIANRNVSGNSESNGNSEEHRWLWKWNGNDSVQVKPPPTSQLALWHSVHQHGCDIRRLSDTLLYHRTWLHLRRWLAVSHLLPQPWPTNTSEHGIRLIGNMADNVYTMSACQGDIVRWWDYTNCSWFIDGNMMLLGRYTTWYLSTPMLILVLTVWVNLWPQMYSLTFLSFSLRLKMVHELHELLHPRHALCCKAAECKTNWPEWCIVDSTWNKPGQTSESLQAFVHDWHPQFNNDRSRRKVLCTMQVHCCYRKNLHLVVSRSYSCLHASSKLKLNYLLVGCWNQSLGTHHRHP